MFRYKYKIIVHAKDCPGLKSWTLGVCKPEHGQPTLPLPNYLQLDLLVRHEKTREHASTARGNFSELRKLLTIINKFLRPRCGNWLQNCQIVLNVYQIWSNLSLYFIFGSYSGLKIGNLCLSCNLEMVICAEIYWFKNSLAETFSLFSCLHIVLWVKYSQDWRLVINEVYPEVIYSNVWHFVMSDKSSAVKYCNEWSIVM